MYSTYIREFDKNVALLEEQSKKNPAFGAVVREFEVTRLVQPVFSLSEGVCLWLHELSIVYAWLYKEDVYVSLFQKIVIVNSLS